MEIIYVEGNIGSGKTTLIDNVAKILKSKFILFHIFLEPVDKWRDLLDKFSRNPKQYHFPLQQKILNHFEHVMLEISKLKNVQIIIIERSVFSAKHVFIKHAIDNNFINKQQFHLLDRKIEKIIKHPNLHIFLDVSYQICYERIKKRGRECELNLSINYIKDLQCYHKEMFNYIKMVVINGEHTPAEICANFMKLLYLKSKNIEKTT